MTKSPGLYTEGTSWLVRRRERLVGKWILMRVTYRTTNNGTEFMSVSTINQV